MITVDEIKETLPARLQDNVTQEIADSINKITQDPDEAAVLREGFHTFSNVLASGKYKIESYLKAVAYVSYRSMGFTKTDSYAKVHPDQYARLIANGASSKKISSYVAQYNGTQLVTNVYAQHIIPAHIKHYDTFDLAVRSLRDIMVDGHESVHARVKAADSLLNHLTKPPETNQIGVVMNLDTNTDLVKGLSKSLDLLVQQQQQHIDKGVTAKDIAATRVVEGTYSEVPNE